jgi:cyanophycin synthetase
MLKTERLSNFDFGKIIFNAQAAGIICEKMSDSELVVTRYKDQVKYLVDHNIPDIPLNYRQIIEDKFFFKQVLNDLGIPVHPAEFFRRTDLESALHYIHNELQWPVVLKAPNLQCGDLVFCAIKDEKTFRTIWEENIIPSANEFFLVERCWDFCPDYRFVIIPGLPPYLVKRTVPTITGNGKESILQLVHKENDKRMTPPRTSLCDIVLSDRDGLRCLAEQGYSLASIPHEGEVIKLRYGTNLSYGGMSEIIDIQSVHPSYWPMLQKIGQFFPELPLLSVDILSYDISLPAVASNMVVSEAHITPGLGMFLSPGKGESVDLYPRLIPLVFPEWTSL